MNFLIIVSLSVLLANPSLARLIDRTEAVVNKQVITLSDIEIFKRNAELRRQTDPFINFLNFNPKSTNEIRDFLVEEAIVLENFSVSDAEIEEQINNVQKQNNNITRDQLISMLSSQGVNFDDYKKVISVVLAKNKLIRQELQPLVNITDDEVKNYYYTGNEFYKRKQNQSIYLSFDLTQILFTSKTTSDAFYELLRNTNDLDAAVSQSNSEMYQINNLGKVKETELAENFRKALRGLKSGEFTKPLELRENVYQILFIKEIGAPKDATFESIKERIRNMLFQTALQKQARLWLDRKTQSAYIYKK